VTTPATSGLGPDSGAGDHDAYAAALQAIADRGRFGIRLGLSRVRALLRGLGDPQIGIRGALVAGTNGKGSVIALAGSALRAAGLRVAETPKPHLVTYRERIVVDGRPIAAGDFARLVAKVLPVADRVARRYGPPTEFELLTAVMFNHFAEAGVDVALVEVGLGGRLDATHAWNGGVAVVTNVDLDHTELLGETVPAIAREKAAIIERGNLAVTGADGEALPVIRRRARRLGVPLTVAAPAPLLGWDRDGLTVELAGLGPTRVGLRGRHQAANVAIADALLDALEQAGIATASPEARRRGYETATWPGRLELLEVPRRDGSGRPLEVLLDGAHNPAGAASLATALDDLRPHLAGAAGSAAEGDAARGRPALTILWASMTDKDVDGVIANLVQARAMEGATVICTQVEAPRALPATALAERWRTIAPECSVEAEPDMDRALDRALASATGPLVVAGSLYLVGAVRARLVDDPLLRDPA
jgi:dihydrofolate synthase / folylpolyglutamate synthase